MTNDETILDTSSYEKMGWRYGTVQHADDIRDVEISLFLPGCSMVLIYSQDGTIIDDSHGRVEYEGIQ